MKKRPKSNFTAKTLFVELDQIKSDFKNSQRSFRAALYQTLERAQRLIFRLRANEKLEREFISKVKRANKSGNPWKSPRDFNLTTEVMAMATGATSRGARKLAWKRGRVLDYLREKKVKVEKTAHALKSRGGLEKIFRAGVEKRHAGSDPELFASTARKIRNSTTKPRVAGSGPAAAHMSNNHEVLVPVWMKLSDRDEIADSQIGSKVSLSGMVVGQKQANLRICQVKFSRYDEDEEPEE
jgi:hypothetical protein